MLPEAGAFEIVFLAAVALIVVGPKDLPMLLRRVGQFTAKMRGLAAEFRASFDEMARQSELDELRKEVDALRNGQFASSATAELNSHVGEINAHLNQTSSQSQNYWDASSQADPVQTFIDPQTGMMMGEGEETAALPPAGARTKPLATKTPRKLAAAAKVAAEPAPSAAEAETVAAPAAKPARKRVAKADKSSNPPGGSPAPADEAAGGLSAIDDDHEIEGSRAPLLTHLAELRTRLIICVAALIVAFIACFAFADPIYIALLRPYQVANALLAESHSHPGPFDLILAMTGNLKVKDVKPPELIFTGPLEFFFTKMKLAAFAAVVVTFPVLAWQLYRFVAPGLYKKERKAFLPFLLAAPVLFIMGAALVYFVMLPFVLWFSLSQQITTTQVHVTLLPKVSDYLELVTKLMLAFGLCFQLPVVLSLVGLAGLVTAQQLGKFRRYAIVGIVFVAALVTPPDPLSQCLLAVPIYGLYEISILCVRLIERGRAKEDARELATT